MVLVKPGEVARTHMCLREQEGPDKIRPPNVPLGRGTEYHSAHGPNPEACWTESGIESGTESKTRPSSTT